MYVCTRVAVTILIARLSMSNFHKTLVHFYYLVSPGQTTFFPLSLGREKKGSDPVQISVLVLTTF